MHQAAFAGDERIVKLLLKHGAKLDVLDQDGKAPVHWATRHNQKKVLEFLIDNGADVNLQTTEGGYDTITRNICISYLFLWCQIL